MGIVEKVERIKEEFRRSDFITTVLTVANEFQTTNAPGISRNEAYVIGALYAIWRNQATWKNQ